MRPPHSDRRRVLRIGRAVSGHERASAPLPARGEWVRAVPSGKDRAAALGSTDLRARGRARGVAREHEPRDGIWDAWASRSSGKDRMGIGGVTLGEPGRGERRALLEVLALAFRDNPMNERIHGPLPQRRVRANRAGLRAVVLDSANDAVTRVLRIDGRVRGGLIALPPGQRGLPRPRLARQIGCAWHQGVRAMEQWSRVQLELGALRPPEPHWYLAVLGVDPGCQGRGAGGMLLEELGRLSARRPAPFYLESDREASIRFYLAHGFALRASRRVLGVDCACLGRGFADAGPNSCDPVRVGARDPLEAQRPASPSGPSPSHPWRSRKGPE